MGSLDPTGRNNPRGLPRQAWRARSDAWLPVCSCRRVPRHPQPFANWRWRLLALSLPIAIIEISPAVAQRRSPSVLVQRVIDGDTIVVASVGRVQLLGVVAPRLGAGPDTSAAVAREAQQRLAGLLANRWVRLEYDVESPGAFRSAYVFLEDGRFVNEWLVREGLARASHGQTLRRLPELREAEAAARRARRGLWRNVPPTR